MAFAKKQLQKLKDLSAEDKKFLTRIADKVSENSETDTSTILASCNSFRCCFSPRRTYHSFEGTSGRRLQGKEDQADFEYSHSCSWTQLTCRRVIIKSYRRYSSEAGMQPIPVLEYKQMAAEQEA